MVLVPDLITTREDLDALPFFTYLLIGPNGDFAVTRPSEVKGLRTDIVRVTGSRKVTAARYAHDVLPAEVLWRPETDYIEGKPRA